MKIKFNSILNIKASYVNCQTIIVRSVFEENDKYYPHVFLYD